MPFEFKFMATVIEWRGPAPFYFVATPPEISMRLNELKRELSYGWGVMHAQLTVSDISVKTALFPKDGAFYVPLKDAIRKPLGIVVGTEIAVTLEL
jgi:hypothetical protein